MARSGGDAAAGAPDEVSGSSVRQAARQDPPARAAAGGAADTSAGRRDVAAAPGRGAAEDGEPVAAPDAGDPPDAGARAGDEPGRDEAPPADGPAGEDTATADPYPAASAGHAAVHEREPRLRVLLYSDDPDTRAAVRLAVGRRPARDLPTVAWVECATAPAVVARADAGGLDVMVLDGEATPVGGMGLCRQLKNEVYRCPPVLVLTGRPDDAWLAAWSLADAAVPHPLDPRALAAAVADLARARLAATRAG